MVDKTKINACFVAGDIMNYGNASDIEQVLNILEFKNLFAVPGNLDTQAALQVLEKRGISIHAKCKQLSGLQVCGFGGGLEFNPGAFLHTEEETEKA